MMDMNTGVFNEADSMQFFVVLLGCVYSDRKSEGGKKEASSLFTFLCHFLSFIQVSNPFPVLLLLAVEVSKVFKKLYVLKLLTDFFYFYLNSLYAD